MLSLREIVKTYVSGDTRVTALRGVSMDFREHEFVSILGPSGCGKTTLLNVIGGLDRYDSGDLIIGGRSTKEFRDADWDTYRNHSIGFVFQSYNLISHQTVLSNVELALTLSGVSRDERRKRAAEALTQVGLGDQLHKKPNQMSGGQMQRVAIARALVNDPDILLADEPTGALDTATSVQIMEILKKVSETRLVVMVTHNPELAAQYSTRIIRVLDGRVVDDSNPYRPGEPETPAEPPAADAQPPLEEAKTPAAGAGEVPAARTPENGPKKGKRSMSFLTALSLSFQNLLTKKTRTLLVAVAGSIGIIGIALILALSNGVNVYIQAIQEETLTSYPISLTAETADFAAILSAMVTVEGEDGRQHEPETVYVDDSISNLVAAMTTTNRNHLADFKDYLTAHWDEIREHLTAVQYTYDMDLQIYRNTHEYGMLRVSPTTLFEDLPGGEGGSGMMGMYTGAVSIFSEIMPGRDGELINPAVNEQYDLLDGRWPEAADELVLVVNRNTMITNLTLYMLGMLDPAEMNAMLLAVMTGGTYESDTQNLSFSFDDFYDLDLNLVYNSDYYTPSSDEFYEVDGVRYPCWVDRRDDENFDPASLFAGGMRLKIVGIVCPDEDANSTSITGALGYTSALTDAVLAHINDSDVVQQQLATPDYDVFTGLPFVIDDADELTDAEKVEKLSGYFGTLSPRGKAELLTAIRTALTDERLDAIVEVIKASIPSVEQRRRFLIDIYALNYGQGSLALGTTVNDAVSAVLFAIQAFPDLPDIDAYRRQVAGMNDMFGLNGVELVPGTSPYDEYDALIGSMYDTDEKIHTAFEQMSRTAVRMLYATMQQAQLAQELYTGPHFQQWCAEQLGVSMTDPGALAAMRNYLKTVLAARAGVPAETFDEYVNGLPMMELMTRGSTVLAEEYGALLEADESLRNAAMAELFDAYIAGLTEADYAALYEDYMEKSDTTLEENLSALGASQGRDALTTINLYPVDFEAKERIQDFIAAYNEGVGEEDQIAYTDLMALIMSSVTTIINAITYVLVAFVSISLVVSSIMIGIITYISVLERTKEIGILRAIGASKRDISRVFNAETLIIGFTAGLIGILFTVLACLPINLIIKTLSGIGNIRASLPIVAALILIAISMGLTLIAGLIPSRIASKKDPVIALRTD